MKILIATDAWHPQVNGVVRTLTSLAKSAAALGADVSFVTPDGFPSVPLPTYPGLRIALPNRSEIARRIEQAAPDAIHIATEGPIGWAARAYCRRRKLAFTTSYTTRFPEYVTELGMRGFRKLGFWTRGVDTELFNPHSPVTLDLPRPIFMTMGRVAVEKNIEAFLSIDMPGSKVVVGDGPQRAQLAKQFPNAVFLGEKKGADLTAHLAAADVFVFPSLTDTFGVVQLEALACGTPVAAFPVTGPKDVIADHPIGAIDGDLRRACLQALTMSREACRKFALSHSWENSARQFIGNLTALQPSRALRPARRATAARPVQS
jgi:glycosyltransferase involved in cell wall biosynthesis